ncbi:polyamine ABC transporter substrate-binding protein [Shinella pollutisoli]|uniref:Polyamine ABC transporter substrate-binding protein n=1 Tax=Shinella pollutisoli TaxID=2250594 RepID=A0ABV7DF93_9HYPH|nr:polyamine ABC transporter substrate-binding protein [Shinella pollutisoli]
MKSSSTKYSMPLARALALGCVLAVPASAQESTITYVTYGGVAADAQKSAIVEPFIEATGINVVMDAPSDYAKAEIQVKSGQVTWDVLTAEPFFIEKQCGVLFEPIDTTIVDTSGFEASDYSTCFVPSYKASYFLAYNKDMVGDNPPQNWADFFDLQKYPGKRALHNYATSGALEAALLADGVKRDELYPLDLPRAIRKLDSIKDSIVFYNTGSEQQQLMEAETPVMVQAWASRFLEATRNGAPYVPQWADNLGYTDSLAVLKGSKNKDAAMKFIAYATSAEAQTRLDELLPYGPVTRDAKPKLPPDMEALLVTNPDIAEKTIATSTAYYAEHFNDAVDAWNDWLNK